MSQIVRIVIHCTDDPADAVRNREYYRRLFFDVYGWHRWGYHYLIYQDGRVETLQPSPTPFANGGYLDNSTIAAGAKGYNHNSLHVAYVGGTDPITRQHADTRTPAQRDAMGRLVALLKARYHIKMVLGHYQLPNVNKACPCFDARKEYSDV